MVTEKKYVFEHLSTEKVRAQPECWDEGVLALGPAHPYQSSGYAACLQSLGFTPVYLRILSHGAEAGRCLFFLKKKRVSCFYGPVLREPEKKNEVHSSLIDWWRSSGYFGLDQFSTAISYGAQDLTNIGNHFRKAETLILDTSVAHLTQYRQMDASVRKNVRRCTEAGVKVEFRADSQAANVYRNLLRSHRQRLGQCMPFFYPTRKNLLLGNGGCTTFTIALASVENVYLSGLGFLSFGSVMTEIGVAQSEESSKRKLQTQDLIKIAAIEYFSAKGVRYYDLAGIESSPKNEKETNIRRFKLKFSNEIRAYSMLGRTAFRPIAFWPSLWMDALQRKMRLT